MEKALAFNVGTQTGASGGRISGKAFDCSRKLYYEDCEKALWKALEALQGPFRRRVKAQRLLECSERFIASLKQLYKKQGGDEVVGLFWPVSRVARRAHEALLLPDTRKFLNGEQRSKDVISTLSILSIADDLLYNALDVLK